MQLHLRKFDLSTIADDKVVVLIGKRETGKSFLVRDLMYHHRDMPIGTVISPTESANKFFGHMIPPLFIHEEYSPAVVDNVVKRQKLILKKIDAQKSLYGSSNIDPRAFLVLDDCMYEGAAALARDKWLRAIFMNGRHFKLFFVLTMQFALGITPILRTNIDYVFLLRENLVSNRKRIYENYAGMFPSFEVFCQVMDQCTEDFECLVINNNAKSNRLDDQVFWYKAEPRPDFQVCAPEVWALSRSYSAAHGLGEDEEDDDNELFSAAAIRKNKGPQVSVKKSPFFRAYQS